MTARARKRAAAAPELALDAPAPQLAAVPAPPPAAITFSIEYGIYGANSKPQNGALWRASFYDHRKEQFYAGSADDPFEAVAWAIYEREERIANHGAPTMTRAGNLTPIQALARLRGRR